MTQEQKFMMLKATTGETDEVLLSAYLDLAGEKICNKCYPFSSGKRDIPEKYHTLQIEIACYLLNKRGAEGETAHSENGINRSYESASVPDSMLKSVVPFVSVLSHGGK